MKKNYNKIIIINIFFLSYFIFFLLLIYPSLKYYEGTKLVYLFYSLSVNIFFLISLFRIFIISLFGILTWLGFWFKFSLAYAVNYYFELQYKTPHLSEAVKNYMIKIDLLVLDNTLIDLTILFLFTSMFIFFISKKISTNFLHMYNNPKYKSFFIIVSIVILSLINFYFGIYQKGFIDEFFENKWISLAYRFFYYIFPNLFLFELIKSNENNIHELKKNFNIFLFLNFLLFTSMLSREFIFFISLIILIFIYKNLTQLRKLDIFYILTIFIVLSLFNIKFTKEIRDCKVNLVDKNISTSNLNFQCVFFEKEISKKYNNEYKIDKNNFFVKNAKEIAGLVIHRWVGLESVYLKKAGINFKDLNRNDEKLNRNFIPGIYYSMFNTNIILSLFYSFIFILFLTLIGRFLSTNSVNYYFYIFFSYVLIYRIYHSGLAITNTIIFIILILSLSYFIKKLTLKYSKHIK